MQKTLYLIKYPEYRDIMSIVTALKKKLVKEPTLYGYESNETNVLSQIELNMESFIPDIAVGFPESSLFNYREYTKLAETHGYLVVELEINI